MNLTKTSLALLTAAALVVPACGSPSTDDGSDGLGAVDDSLRSGVVRVYAAGDFGGDHASFAVGDHSLSGTKWNDAIQSIRVFGDYSVELFADDGYRGTSMIVSGDNATLGALSGKVTSIRIQSRSGGGTPVPTVPPPSPPPPPPPSTGGGTPAPAPGAPAGWASVAGMGRTGTTGGAGGPTVRITSVKDFNARAAGTAPAVLEVAAALDGDVAIGPNKTITGVAGGSIHGHVEMDGSVNVIVQNLKVVGYNCADNADCQSGADAITVRRGAHHLWFDHCDVSDGSDGNLDITHASDYVTISWTKFSYSGARPGGHQFSNLIGHTDSNPEDEGHLKVTLHHDWWANNVGERMPRVRYGQVHSYNNLFTATGNNYCVRAGVKSEVLSEANAFLGVDTPFDLGGGDVLSRGDVFVKATGNLLGTGKAFTPPYAYTLDAASAVEARVRAGAGTR
jgi:pectate lyase